MEAQILTGQRSGQEIQLESWVGACDLAAHPQEMELGPLFTTSSPGCGWEVLLLKGPMGNSASLSLKELPRVACM